MSNVFTTGMSGPEAIAALNALYVQATEGGEGALALLNQFKSRYYGALAADPVLDPLGDAVGIGDMYFNSEVGYLKIYSGTTWERPAFEAEALAAVEASKNLAVNTTIPGKVALVEAFKNLGIADIAAKVAAIDPVAAASYVGQANAARDLAGVSASTAVAARDSAGSFDTLGGANAALGSIAANAGVYVISDTANNNGFYVKQLGVLVKKSADTLITVVQRIAKTNRRGWAWLVRGADGKLGIGVNKTGRVIFGVGGDIYGLITANTAALASAVASIVTYKTTFNPARRGNSIFRVTDKLRQKVAIEVTRSGRFLVLGREPLALIDAMVLKLTGIGVRPSRGPGVVVRDAAGKSPLAMTRSGWLLLRGRNVLVELDALKAAGTSTAYVDALIFPGKNLLVVGDSLSQPGNSWASTMAAALTITDRVTTNLSVGGMTSSQQAGRLGAIPFQITFLNNKILAVGATSIIGCQVLMPDGAMDSCYPINSQGINWRARVAGILGAFSSATFDVSGNPTALVFTPDALQLGADLAVDVGVPTAAAWATGHEHDLLLVGLGRNNYFPDANIARRVGIVQRDVLAIRDYWQTTPNKRMIFVTPPNAYRYGDGTLSTEGSNNPANFAFFLSLERWAQAVFGECAVLSRQLLMRYADPNNAEDAAAVAIGCVPPLLTTDGLHWTATAQTYIRNPGASTINRKGY